MKYFIDFEATQFSNEIIQVGCLCEDGRTFSSLVKPKKKITNFITQLTGITQEMVDNAPTSDEVFSDFFDWLSVDTTATTFLCYGSSDTSFVRKNLKSLTTTFKAQAALSIIASNLQDFSYSAMSHFGSHKAISLAKIVAFYRGVESIQQTHDALEDARFLQEIYTNIRNEPAYDMPPFGDAKYALRIEVWDKNAIIETFDSYEKAIEWAKSKMALPKSSLESIKDKNIKNRIINSNNSNKEYMYYKWKILKVEV